MNHLQTEQNVLVLATENAHKVEEIKAILEASSLLKGRVIKAISDYTQKPVLRETGTTLEENARLKAEQTATFFEEQKLEPRLWGVLSDDSGLCVDALNGAPGVYSARYAEMGGQSEETAGMDRDAANRRRLLMELASVSEKEHRTAAFLTTLVLLIRKPPNQEPQGAEPSQEAQKESSEHYCVTGKATGWISFDERGKEGFGYDPVFIPDDFAQSEQTQAHVQSKKEGKPPSLANIIGRSFAEMSAQEKNSFSHRQKALKQLIEVFEKSRST